MSVAYAHYPELHRLVERLRPDAVPVARAALLCLVESEPGDRLATLPSFDGPEDLRERMDGSCC
jgi:hypothetical protein